MHFTLTSASLTNLVERFLTLLAQGWIKRDSHRSARELEHLNREYVETYHHESRPFVWHETADQIIASIAL